MAEPSPALTLQLKRKTGRQFSPVSFGENLKNEEKMNERRHCATVRPYGKARRQ